LTSVQRNNVKISGKGSKVIMFAHGYGCDQAMWRSVAPSFENDYKVILFDYVGSGHSDPTAFSHTQYSTLRGYAADVIAIIEELKLEKVNFIAHSVSSMIGALAAIQRPELFDNLVMIGPSPSYINDGEYLGGFERSDIEDLLEMLDNNHSGWSAMMAPIIMGNPERPELAAELEASFCSTDPIHAQHFARVTFLSDNRADLLNLRSRTLILQCDKDAIAPVSVGQYVQRCIPKSQLIVMEATGHCPHLSSPGVVTEAIRNFL
jgi:Predicted hydrolases or acyltransferases (alpha/beta hydrolase superfamily)